MPQPSSESGTDKTIRLVSKNGGSPVKIGTRNGRQDLTVQPLVPTSVPGERDSYSSTALGEVVDRSTHAALARYTFGLSPAALAEAYVDWATHLATSPGKQMQLVQKGARKFVRLVHHVAECACGRGSEPCI